MRPRPLVRNVGVNLAGQVAPLLAAAISMPWLASGFGAERLGVLTLAWVVLGSFGLLDLGLGRALTQLVSAKLAVKDEDALPGLFGAGCGLLGALGIVCALALGLSADWLTTNTFHVSPDLQSEALGSFYLLVAGLPFLTISSAARGFLEAHQRFAWVNIVRAPLGVLTYAGPVMVLPFSTSVTAGVAIIVAARIAACLVYIAMGWALLATSRPRALLNTADIRALLSGGAWMTSANVVASIIAAADRVLVGAAVSIEALAYYATPQEIIGRVTILPTTVSAVIFPAFSASWAQRSDALTRLFEKTSFYTHLATFPITLVGATFAGEWLSLWMGPAFAAHGTTATQIFCLGVYLNGMAVTPFSLLQAVDRADLTAKIQLYELPPYLLALWMVSARFGITGAAVVWGARTLVNVVAFYVISGQQLPAPRTVIARQGRVLVPACVAFVLIAAGSTTVWTIAIFAIASIWFVASIKSLSDPEDWRDARSLMLAVRGAVRTR